MRSAIVERGLCPDTTIRAVRIIPGTDGLRTDSSAPLQKYEQPTPQEKKRDERPPHEQEDVPSYYFHPTFVAPDGEDRYDAQPLSIDRDEVLSDPKTRTIARCMHYAAFRLEQTLGASGDPHDVQAERNSWHGRHAMLRAMVWQGNYRLVYKAVHALLKRWESETNNNEDWEQDAMFILRRAVTRYNPWDSVKFNTYACNSIIRSLQRDIVKVAQRPEVQFALVKIPGTSEYASMEGSIPSREGDPLDTLSTGQDPSTIAAILHERIHAVLLDREIHAIMRHSADKKRTLKQMGTELGISKERVRQLEVHAKKKLREDPILQALLTPA